MQFVCTFSLQKATAVVKDNCYADLLYDAEFYIPFFCCVKSASQFLMAKTICLFRDEFSAWHVKSAPGKKNQYCLQTSLHVCTGPVLNSLSCRNTVIDFALYA